MADWEELVDLYTDYLIVVNGQATATGLSDVLDNEISHDKFRRMVTEVWQNPFLYQTTH